MVYGIYILSAHTGPQHSDKFISDSLAFTKALARTSGQADLRGGARHRRGFALSHCEVDQRSYEVKKQQWSADDGRFDTRVQAGPQGLGSSSSSSSSSGLVARQQRVGWGQSYAWRGEG